MCLGRKAEMVCSASDQAVHNNKRNFDPRERLLFSKRTDGASEAILAHPAREERKARKRSVLSCVSALERSGCGLTRP